MRIVRYHRGQESEISDSTRTNRLSKSITLVICLALPFTLLLGAGDRAEHAHSGWTMLRPIVTASNNKIPKLIARLRRRASATT